MSEAADSYLVGIFYIVRDCRRGALPATMTSDPAFMAEVARLADQLPLITADASLKDVRVSISPDLERSYWSDTNRAANCLKHADRDIGQVFPLEAIDNMLLLMKGASAYQDVAPDDLGNEGLVFQAFATASNESYRLGSSSFDSVVSSLRRVSADQRRRLCYTFRRNELSGVV